jgi:hypothetical protein
VDKPFTGAETSSRRQRRGSTGRHAGAFSRGSSHRLRTLIEALTLPDPDDRHVLAAAIRCGAQQIITENLADFPDDALASFSAEASSCDDFLLRTFELYPAQAVEILSQVRQSYRKPSFAASEFILDLTARGMPKLASRLGVAPGFIRVF